jgi:hypothetical protein
MVPTLPPTARCLSCHQRRLSSDLCPVCQMCAGCGCPEGCLRIEDEDELRAELSEGAAESPCPDVGMDAEVDP